MNKRKKVILFTKGLFLTFYAITNTILEKETKKEKLTAQLLFTSIKGIITEK
jgi:hypothetical protein